MGNVSQPYLLHVEQVAIDHDDFDAAAQSHTINVGVPVPPNCHVISYSIECTEAPLGGGITSYDVQVGDGVDSAGFCTAEDHLALGVGVYQAYGAFVTAGMGFNNAARQITATATVDGAHQTQDATAGEWTCRYAYIQFYD